MLLVPGGMEDLSEVMTTSIKVTVEAGIRTIKFDRPEKKNALNEAMYAALNEALELADQDPSTRVILFTAEGSTFSSGNDLGGFAMPEKEGGPSEGSRFPLVLENTRKPVIAAVNGAAIGVGMTMLAQCDLVYASDKATFSAPFADFGLVPEGASSRLLPLLAGHARASALLMLGDIWTAEEALQAGLLTGVFPDADLADGTLSIAQRLAAKAPSAIRGCKRLMRRARGDVTAHILAAEADFAQSLQSEEFAEAISAFLGRRRPDFSKFS